VIIFYCWIIYRSFMFYSACVYHAMPASIPNPQKWGEFVLCSDYRYKERGKTYQAWLANESPHWGYWRNCELLAWIRTSSTRCGKSPDWTHRCDGDFALQWKQPCGKVTFNTIHGTAYGLL